MENDKENVSPTEDESRSSTSKPKAPSIEDFKLIKPISRGAFGKVFLGYKNGHSRKMYAVKVVKKSDIVNKNMVNQVIIERDALALSKSPFVVKLYYSLQTRLNIYLVMEYMIGGDVKSLLGIYGYFDEDMAVRYTAEVTLALEYLHSHGIIHRDLKPDNMLISDSGHIKLTDFGLSKISLDHDLNLTDLLSTPSGGKPRNLAEYYRTPGQLLSLTSALSFHTPSAIPKHVAPSSCARLSTGHPSPLEEKPVKSQPNTGKELESIRTYRTASRAAQTPPIKSLTPTLEQSRHWLTSTASEQSSVSFHRPPSKLVSSLYQRTAGSGKSDKPAIRKAEDCSSDDTPLLCRTKEAMRSSRAAQNLRHMRQGSPNAASDILEEYHRSASPELSGQTGCKVGACSRSREPLQRVRSRLLDNPDSDAAMTPVGTGGTKRMFHQVEKSPCKGHRNCATACGGSYTGMTSEFTCLGIVGDERQLKRINSVQNMEHVEDEEKGSAIHRTQSLKSFDEYVKVRHSTLNSSLLSSLISSAAGNNSSAYFGEVSSAANGSEFNWKGSKLLGDVLRSGTPTEGSLELNEGHESLGTDSSSNAGMLPSLDEPDHMPIIISPIRADGRNGRLLMSGCDDMPPCGMPVDPPVFVDLSASSPHDKHVNDVCQRKRASSALDHSMQELSLEDSDSVFDSLSEDGAARSASAVPLELSDVSIESDQLVLSPKAVVEDGDVEPQMGDACVSDLREKLADVSNIKDFNQSRNSSGGDSHCQHALQTVPEDGVPMSCTTSPCLNVTPPLQDHHHHHDSSTSSRGTLSEGRQKKVTVLSYVSTTSSALSRSRCMSADRGATSRLRFKTPVTQLGGRTPARNVAFTPFRTPKSVRRGPKVTEQRILGTPDYLAPELLLKNNHDESVDWWALGVCLFEFLTGVPPFNDQTPELVFQNILSKDIPWPEGEECLSSHAQEAIDELLTLDPDRRPKSRELKEMQLFVNVNWTNLLNETPPFVPNPEDETDTSYFDARNTLQNLKVSAIDL